MEFLRKPNTKPGIIFVESEKFGYIPIPKAGCSSIKYEISKLLNLEFQKKEVHAAMKPFMRRDFSKEELKDYFIFSIVRNPFSRILSAFTSKVTPFKGKNTPFLVNGVQKALNVFYGDSFYGGMTFKQYLKNLSEIPDEYADEHFRSQHTFVFDTNSNQLADYVGKLENLGEEIRYLNEKFNFPFENIGHFGNRSIHKHYSYYYDDEMIDIMKKRYVKDLELFEYQYEDLSNGTFRDPRVREYSCQVLREKSGYRIEVTLYKDYEYMDQGKFVLTLIDDSPDGPNKSIVGFNQIKNYIKNRDDGFVFNFPGRVSKEVKRLKLSHVIDGRNLWLFEKSI